jgi:hypothetical protein
MNETPEVAADAHLLLLRDARDVILPAGTNVNWLSGVGLDGTIKECALAVLSYLASSLLDLAGSDERVRVYRPISDKIRAL